MRRLPIERVAELGRTFEHIVCTGVLHHLADPDAGLRSLREVLHPAGAMHLMLYAPYGRAGIYMLQDYCRRVGAGRSQTEIRDLAATLRALPPDHPIVPLLQNSPDFGSIDGVADALLHPRDRAYSVPEVMELLDRTEMLFGRWIRQAPYLPSCGAPAETPHASKLAALPARAQYAALELLRGSMTRHSFSAYRNNPRTNGKIALDYVPVRLPDTIVVQNRLPEGAAAVLINRNHVYTDLYLPIDETQARLLAAIDAEHTIGQLCGDNVKPHLAHRFFKRLWDWDQVVFDSSRSER